jgi:hypothetical protein
MRGVVWPMSPDGRLTASIAEGDADMVKPYESRHEEIDWPVLDTALDSGLDGARDGSNHIARFYG